MNIATKVEDLLQIQLKGLSASGGVAESPPKRKNTNAEVEPASNEKEIDIKITGKNALEQALKEGNTKDLFLIVFLSLFIYFREKNIS